MARTDIYIISKNCIDIIIIIIILLLLLLIVSFHNQLKLTNDVEVRQNLLLYCICLLKKGKSFICQDVSFGGFRFCFMLTLIKAIDTELSSFIIQMQESLKDQNRTDFEKKKKKMMFYHSIYMESGV